MPTARKPFAAIERLKLLTMTIVVILVAAEVHAASLGRHTAIVVGSELGEGVRSWN